jgi:hypothetical protein
VRKKGIVMDSQTKTSPIDWIFFYDWLQTVLMKPNFASFLVLGPCSNKMSMLDYEIRGIAQTIKMNAKLGVFNSPLPTFGVTLHATCLAFPLHVRTIRSWYSHMIGTRAHRIILDELTGQEMSNTQIPSIEFKDTVLELIASKSPVVVSVIISSQGTCEAFSSFMTGASAQLYVGHRKGVDVKKFIVQTNTTLHSKFANCAQCMAEIVDVDVDSDDIDFPFDRPLKKCSRCKSVFYCSEQCQRADWERGHSTACDIFQWLTPRLARVRQGSDQEWIDGIVGKYKLKMEKCLANSQYVTE